MAKKKIGQMIPPVDIDGETWWTVKCRDCGLRAIVDVELENGVHVKPTHCFSCGSKNLYTMIWKKVDKSV